MTWIPVNVVVQQLIYSLLCTVVLFFVGVNFLIKSLIMTKEKCWKCKKVKANVRLRATDDRLCEACFEANEKALRQIQLGDNMAAASVIVNEHCSVTP